MSLELKTKKNHNEKRGIYAESVWCGRKDIPLAEEMVEYVDSQKDVWDKEYGLKAWAIAHAQLTDSPEPKRIFVVSNELVDTDEAERNTRFPSRMIFNARILELQTHFEKKKEVQKTVMNEKTGRREIKDVVDTYKVPNIVPMEEGCMSFPHRKPKKIDRIFRVKVAYSYPVTIWGFTFLWPKREWVEGLKAQIFQHEQGHFEGENIYYPKQKERESVTLEQHTLK